MSLRAVVRHGLVGVCLGWVAAALAQAPLRDASVEQLVERLAPPAPGPGTRGLRNLVPQPAAPRQVDLVVHFEFDSAELGRDSRELLDRLSQALASDRLAGSRFRIEGHTDAKGAAAYNLALSHKRAQAVLMHLASRGVPAERMQAEGMGFEQLLLADKPFAAENRRVRVLAME